MSIESYLLNIRASRNAIREKLISLGLATSGDQLERLAAIIEDIVGQSAVTVTIKDGETYTIPAGLHDGSGSVIAVSNAEKYKLQAKTVTPIKARQNITPDDEYWGLSNVLVAAIPDMYQDISGVTANAPQVLVNYNIVDPTGTLVSGTMPNNGIINKAIDGLTVTSAEIPAGYTLGGTIHLTNDIEERLSKI